VLRLWFIAYRDKKVVDIWRFLCRIRNLVPSFSLDKIVIIPSDFLLYFWLDIVPVPTLVVPFYHDWLYCASINFSSSFLNPTRIKYINLIVIFAINPSIITFFSMWDFNPLSNSSNKIKVRLFYSANSRLLVLKHSVFLVYIMGWNFIWNTYLWFLKNYCFLLHILIVLIFSKELYLHCSI
jgi:hypothetical protein